MCLIIVRKKSVRSHLLMKELIMMQMRLQVRLCCRIQGLIKNMYPLSLCWVVEADDLLDGEALAVDFDEDFYDLSEDESFNPTDDACIAIAVTE
jgi:hypothetical protein